MLTKIEEINELFTRKNALMEALEALKKEHEIAIEKKLKQVFNNLTNTLKKYDFTIVIFTHYKEMRATVFKYFKEENELKIKIVDYEVSEVLGEDKELEEVLKIVKEELKKLQKEFERVEK